MKSGVCISMAAILCGGAASYGSPITYQEDVNAYSSLVSQIREDSADTIFDPSAETINIGASGASSGSGRMRTVFGFDLAGIPAGATVTSVALHIVTSTGVGNAGTIELHRIHHATSSMDEASVTWNQVRAGVNWATPGGDFDTAVLSSYAQGSSFGVAAHDFASSPAFVQAAQEALDSGTPLELIAISTAEAVRNNYVAIDSDDNHNISRHPLLSVDYTVAPEPMAMGLLTLCGGALMLRRRRARC